ncbi:hypothetical protein Q3G72_022044 [Acer saccharum]|nr:hypothetical protein Q3G72_022044 [Acer saccharum]
MANWADLGHDVLTEIVWRIKLHEDFVVFREVCISWRSVAVIENFTNKCNQIPWLMLPSKRRSNLCELLSISKGTTRQVTFKRSLVFSYSLAISISCLNLFR